MTFASRASRATPHTTSITCAFLSGQQAYQWVSQHHDAYIQRTAASPANASARTYSSVDSFCAQLRDWSPVQKKGLAQLVGSLVAACWSWRRLLADDDWLFLKSADTLEDGMPHTIHNAIVLPERLVQRLVEANATGSIAREGASPPTGAAFYAVETLLHERVHVLQKLHPARFAALYRDWGYLPPTPSQARAIRDLHRHHVFRTNPDTPTDWVWRGEWYPFAELVAPTPPAVYDLRRCAHQLVHLPSRRWVSMPAAPEYTAFHGTNPHCYHPEETAAVLLAAEMAGDVWAKQVAGGGTGTTTVTEALVRMRRWCAHAWHV